MQSMWERTNILYNMKVRNSFIFGGIEVVRTWLHSNLHR